MFGSLILFILNRTVVAFLIFITATLLIFNLIDSQSDLLPTLTPAQREQVESQRDVSFSNRYTDWLEGSFESDWGSSLVMRREVAEVIKERAGTSVELLVLAGLLSFCIGIPLGILLGGLRYHVAVQVIRPLIIVLGALPVFWLGLMLLYQLGFKQDWFPLGGRFPVRLNDEPALVDRLDYLVLPVTTLALPWIGGIALYLYRTLTQGVAQTVNQRMGEVVASIVLLIPAFLAQAFAALLLVETLFAFPGVGRLAINAIFQRDFPVLGAVAFQSTLMIALTYFWCSLLYGVIMAISGLKPQTEYIVSPLPYFIGAGNERSQPVPPKPAQVISNGCAGIAAVGVLLIIVVFNLATPLNTALNDDSQPTRTDPSSTFLKPGEDGHRLGTDELGRDFLARLLYAGRNSLRINFGAALMAFGIALVLGVIGGIPWGIVGQVINVPINWAVMTLNALVLLLFLLLAMSMTDSRVGDKASIAVLFGTFGWSPLVPLIRERVAVVREGIRNGSAKAPDFASRMLLGTVRLFIYALVLAMAHFLLLEAALSFLGLGIRPPEPSLGNLMNNAPSYFQRGAHLFTIPGGVLTLLVFGLLIIAERLRDTLDFTFLPAEPIE